MSDSVWQQVQCPICRHVVTEPRMLVCGHSACTICLTNESKLHPTSPSRAVFCPRCRTQTTFDLWGALGLPRDTQLLELVASLQNSHPPPSSSSAPASSASQMQPVSYFIAPPQPLPFEPIFLPTTPSHEYTTASDILPSNDGSADQSCQPRTSFNTVLADDVTAPSPNDEELSDFTYLSADSPLYSSPSSSSSSSNAASSSSTSPGESEAGGFGSLLTKAAKWWRPSPPRLTGTVQHSRYAPFELTAEAAATAMVEHLGRLWFAPTNFANELRFGHVLPAYQLFYVLSVDVATLYHFEGEDVQPYLRSYKHVVLSASAASHLTQWQPFLDQLTDWDFKKATLTEPGTTIETLPSEAVPFESAWERWYQRTQAEHRGVCEQLLLKENARRVFEQGQDAIHIEKPIEITHSFSNQKHALVHMPVYISKYLYQGGEHCLVVNAQSGAIALDRVFGLGSIGSIGSKLTSVIDRWLFSS